MTEPLADLTALPAAKITSSIVMVDAAMAVRLLDCNTHNRPISAQFIERYRRDMVAGRWKYADDPIRFDTEGTLLDGQHRLLALSQCPNLVLPFRITRGLQPESQQVMDQGRKRTPGQQLGLHKVRNANLVAAGIKLYLIWQEGFLFRDNKFVNLEITSIQIEDWVSSNSASVSTLGSFIGDIRSSDAPPSVAYASAISFLGISEELTRGFFNGLHNGAGGQGHPITTLDKRLQRIRRERIKVPHRDYLALFIMAWNAWREDRTVTKLQAAKGNWTPESFPVPK